MNTSLGIGTGVLTTVSSSCRANANAKNAPAPTAASGRQLPKITAARAMNPLPAVMLVENEPELPSVR